MSGPQRHPAVAVVLRDIQRSQCAWCGRYAAAVEEESPDEFGRVTFDAACCKRPTCAFARKVIGEERAWLIDEWTWRAEGSRRKAVRRG